jgi:hypothetical protein
MKDLRLSYWESIGKLQDRLASEIAGGARSVTVTREEWDLLRSNLNQDTRRWNPTELRFYGVPILVDNELPSDQVVCASYDEEGRVTSAVRLVNLGSGGEGDA